MMTQIDDDLSKTGEIKIKVKTSRAWIMLGERDLNEECAFNTYQIAFHTSVL